MKNVINVTKSAWNKMENIMNKSNNKFENIIKLKPNNLKYKNVNLYIDPLSEMYLIGTTIDYITEDYNKGIFENKFNYTIDRKLASSCGCGISFMPKKI